MSDNTPDMFSGAAMRDSGCAQVLAHNPDWQARFDATATEILAREQTVTSEAVVACIGMPPGSPNAVGAAMRAFASRQGLRKLCYRNSARPSCHAAVIAVWGKQP